MLLCSPVLNDSPTFPPTSSRQILQLYCPDSRAAGAQATKGSEGGGGGGGGGGDGKENGQSGDKRGRNGAPHHHHHHPGLTSTPSHPLHPSPLPPPRALSLPCNTSPICSTALPHVTGVQTASGAAWHYQASLGECGRGRGAGVAEWPCGGSGPFLQRQQRSSNDCELQLCPLRLALPCPAVAPQPHLTVLP